MKTIIWFLLVASLVLTHISIAQWVRTNGPYGGSVYAFAVSGGTLFAGTGGGVFRSTNNGSSWNAENVGLTNPCVLALAVSGANIFAGTSEGGVFLSTNEGATWHPVSNGLPKTLSFPDLYQQVNTISAIGANLFAGIGYASDSAGVYLSTNNGANWIAVTPPYGPPYGRPFTFGDTSTGVAIFACFRDMVFQSTNNGVTWSKSSPAISAITTLAVSPNGTGGINLFAGTAGRGVIFSTDSGASWTELNAGLTNRYVQNIFLCSNGKGGSNLFASIGVSTDVGASGVFLSTNNGASWSACGLGNECVNSFAADGSNLYAGTNADGAYLSTDHGANWTSASTGMTNASVPVLATLPVTGGACLFAGVNRSVYRSTDEGASWTTVNGLTHNGSLAFAVSDKNLFAGTYGGVFVSTDNGANWAATRLTDTCVTTIAVSETNLFAGTSDSGVFLSTNKGSSWHAVDTGLTNTSVTALASSGTDLFAGTSDSGIFLSTDSGTSWKAVNNGLPREGRGTYYYYDWVNGFAVAGTSLLVSYGEGSVFLSSNKGTNWSQVEVLALPTVGGMNLFAATSTGLSVSTNNGASWNAITTTGLPNGYISSLAASDANLFACVNGIGVWRRPLSEIITGIDEQKSEIPSHFALEQNYPNPFNPTTVISYHLPAGQAGLAVNSQVTLKVYDLLGREVTTLVNERQGAGTYSVQWNASGFSSGVYFYRLEADGKQEIRKMSMIK